MENCYVSSKKTIHSIEEGHMDGGPGGGGPTTVVL